MLVFSRLATTSDGMGCNNMGYGNGGTCADKLEGGSLVHYFTLELSWGVKAVAYWWHRKPNDPRLFLILWPIICSTHEYDLEHYKRSSPCVVVLDNPAFLIAGMQTGCIQFDIQKAWQKPLDERRHSVHKIGRMKLERSFSVGPRIANWSHI